MYQMISQRAFLIFPIILVPLAVAVLYYPGLTGTFLLDDFHTLEPLGNFGSINTLDKLLFYIFSGNTGPTGRPVALLTFAINSQTWPADPYWFLLTNIAIHAVNSLLVYLFLFHLLSYSEGRSNKVCFIAGLSTIAWALHPFHVSSVLYIVQRMTLLSCSFSLLALIFFLFSRRAIDDRKDAKAIVNLGAVFICAVLAVFSKENAVLLPIQMLLVELFLRTQKEVKTRWLGKLVVLAIFLLSSVVFLYLMKIVLTYLWEFYATGVQPSYGRSFTLVERVLTELRVVGDYLIDLLIPKAQTAGVFHDHYPISIGLLSPPATMFWLVAHVVFVLLACVFRRYHPIVFFGVLWFYISHILESSVLMLEIKFEHRNYVPSIGVALLLSYFVSLISRDFVRYLVGLGLISVYAGLLFLNVSLWGNPVEAAVVWVEENPRSSRALENAARQLVQKRGDAALAKDFVRRSVLQSKTSASELRYISAFCETYNGQPVNWDELAERLKTEPADWALYNTLEDILDFKINGECDLVDMDGYKKLLSAYRENRSYKNNLSLYLVDEYEIRANLYLGEVGLALSMEENQLQKLMPLAFAMRRAGIFATAGYLDIAAKSLEIRIRAAEQLDNEDRFTLENAKEMLALIKADMR